jgi:hypothetical protein
MLLLVSLAQAGPACPDNATLSEFWPGEYPGPVVQVNKKLTVEALKQPCGTKTLTCTVDKGLYHPWSEAQKGSKVSYFSLQPVSSYALLRELSLDGTSYPRGTVVQELAYLSEGMCSLKVGDRTFPENCPGSGGQEDTWLELKTGQEPVQLRQFLRVDCVEGHQAYVVVDEAFLARPKVVKGVITGYGSVGRQGDEGI